MMAHIQLQLKPKHPELLTSNRCPRGDCASCGSDCACQLLIRGVQEPHHCLTVTLQPVMLLSVVCAGAAW
jgi:hypothetical protein